MKETSELSEFQRSSLNRSGSGAARKKPELGLHPAQGLPGPAAASFSARAGFQPPVTRPPLAQLPRLPPSELCSRLGRRPGAQGVSPAASLPPSGALGKTLPFDATGAQRPPQFPPFVPGKLLKAFLITWLSPH